MSNDSPPPSASRRVSVVSIHDLTPQTLSQTRAIIEFLKRENVGPVTLLVVPGVEWPQREVDTLRKLQDAGYELAGHGWSHQCSGWGSWWHRLHGLVISRKRAEHLSLRPAEIMDTISRCYDWFATVKLNAPRLYVPPAWALGSVRRDRLRETPFEAYEVLTGVHYPRAGRFARMPLVGYEADTRWRVPALRTANAANRCLARCLKRPLRISIHPHDFELHLAEDLRKILRQERDWRDYFGACEE
jgi:predicted deacetylase